MLCQSQQKILRLTGCALQDSSESSRKLLRHQQQGVQLALARFSSTSTSSSSCEEVCLQQQQMLVMMSQRTSSKTAMTMMRHL
jgi:hypothetical protein